MKIRLHPLFFVLVLVLVFMGQGLVILWSLLALILHETGHGVVSRSRGFVLRDMSLMPYGAELSTSDILDKKSSILIALAGPMVSLVVALLTLGLWWLYPALYSMTEPFFYANLSLFVFNILPIYPLDGSRIVLGCAKNRSLAVKVLKISGLLSSIALVVLFVCVLLLDGVVNINLLIAGIFMCYSAVVSVDRETYVSVYDKNLKNFDNGVEVKTIKVSENIPLIRLYRHINSASEIKFQVVDQNKNVIAEFDEKELAKFAVRENLHCAVGKALSD